MSNNATENSASRRIATAVSYTHLDVYKRQVLGISADMEFKFSGIFLVL